MSNLDSSAIKSILSVIGGLSLTRPNHFGQVFKMPPHPDSSATYVTIFDIIARNPIILRNVMKNLILLQRMFRKNHQECLVPMFPGDFLMSYFRTKLLRRLLGGGTFRRNEEKYYFSFFTRFFRANLQEQREEMDSGTEYMTFAMLATPLHFFHGAVMQHPNSIELPVHIDWSTMWAICHMDESLPQNSKNCVQETSEEIFRRILRRMSTLCDLSYRGRTPNLPTYGLLVGILRMILMQEEPDRLIHRLDGEVEKNQTRYLSVEMSKGHDLYD
jgi:hypothetical protein